jgi:Tfp pilus assembly protein PilX
MAASGGRMSCQQEQMMILVHGKKPERSERGVALIVALMLLLLISAALMGMIMMSNTETNVSANFRDEQTAFFASKAGVEEVRDRMRAGATTA